jgi:GMP synthase (glutamine-hydrolysing)
MILLVDNGSHYIKELSNTINVDHEVRKPYEVKELEYDAVILSGRTKNDNITNRDNIKIVRHCNDNSIPLLGICYGAEILALALGGTIRRLEKRIEGYHEVIITKNPLIDKEKITVFKSHKYVISKLPEGFRSIGYSKNSNNEIIIRDNIIGLQFHPEMSNDGMELLSNLIERVLLLGV